MELMSDTVKDQEVIFRELVELNEAGLFTLENDIFTYANPAFCRLLKKDLSEIKGKSIYDFLLKEDAENLQQQINQMSKGQLKVISDNFRKENDQNTIQYISLHLKVTSLKEDGAFRIIGASRDSTERVTASNELKRTKKKYELLYRNMLQGVFIYDYINETIVDSNEACLKTLGFDTLEELKQLNRFDIIPQHSKYFPDVDIHEVTRGHGVAVFKGESFSTPGVFVNRKGEDVLANVNVIPTFHKKGEAYIIFHDITRQILNRKAVKASEKRYRDIFENSHEAITFLDVNSGKLIDCNNNALKLYGAQSKDDLFNLPKENFHENFLLHHYQSKEYMISKIHEAFNKGKSYVTFEAKKLNGEEFIFEAVIISDKSENGRPKLITFAKDTKDIINAEEEKNKLITTLLEAKKEIHDRNEELKKYIASNLQLENFAYFASHDLRTPLRSIISFTQLLNRKIGDRLSEEETEYMNFIISAGNNMQTLIDDLLSFSRINNAQPNIKAIEVKTFLEQVNTQLSSSINDNKAVIKIKKIPKTIFADQTKLSQLFQNLISNAIKFTTKDIVPSIEIKGVTNKHHWQFSVKDNGIGIEEAYKEKIFLMFKRLHTTKEYEGTGIGLALCKKVIEQHNGKIWFESVPGEGTTFHFTIKKGL